MLYLEKRKEEIYMNYKIFVMNTIITNKSLYFFI